LLVGDVVAGILDDRCKVGLGIIPHVEALAAVLGDDPEGLVVDGGLGDRLAGSGREHRGDPEHERQDRGQGYGGYPCSTCRPRYLGDKPPTPHYLPPLLLVTFHQKCANA
jgi:hypothetical protein